MQKIHIWEIAEIDEVWVQRGQPSIGSLRALMLHLLMLPFYLIGFAVLTVITLGLFPIIALIRWLSDRMRGTYLVIQTTQGRVWFFMKSTALDEADGALGLLVSE